MRRPVLLAAALLALASCRAGARSGAWTSWTAPRALPESEAAAVPAARARAEYYQISEG